MRDVHVIQVAVSRHGSYRWVCSCGDRGRRVYGYVGLAERYGQQHAEAKTNRS